MKKLNIEWKHYDKEGKTCTRCNNTGDNIKKVLEKISEDSNFKGVEFEYIETKLGAKEMRNSNTVLINDLSIEEILSAKASENYCHSCSCLEGKDTYCRTIEVKGSIYEIIPEELIFEAIKKRLKT